MTIDSSPYEVHGLTSYSIPHVVTMSSMRRSMLLLIVQGVRLESLSLDDPSAPPGPQYRELVASIAMNVSWTWADTADPVGFVTEL